MNLLWIGTKLINLDHVIMVQRIKSYREENTWYNGDDLEKKGEEGTYITFGTSGADVNYSLEPFGWMIADRNGGRELWDRLLKLATIRVRSENIQEEA